MSGTTSGLNGPSLWAGQQGTMGTPAPAGGSSSGLVPLAAPQALGGGVVAPTPVAAPTPTQSSPSWASNFNSLTGTLASPTTSTAKATPAASSSSSSSNVSNPPQLGAANQAANQAAGSSSGTEALQAIGTVATIAAMFA